MWPHPSVAPFLHHVLSGCRRVDEPSERLRGPQIHVFDHVGQVLLCLPLG